MSPLAPSTIRIFGLSSEDSRSLLRHVDTFRRESSTDGIEATTITSVYRESAKNFATDIMEKYSKRYGWSELPDKEWDA